MMWNLDSADHYGPFSGVPVKIGDSRILYEILMLFG